MNMINKVAEAIRDNVAAALPDGVSVDYRYAAIAAIEAMRDPSPDIIAAVWHNRGRLGDVDIYQHFINAVLEGR